MIEKIFFLLKILLAGLVGKVSSPMRCLLYAFFDIPATCFFVLCSLMNA